MRIYVPSTLTTLAAAARNQQLHVLHGTAFGVTKALVQAYPDGNTEELEYLAMLDAARASLRLMAAEDRDGRRTTLRVVVAADVNEVTERDDLDRAVVRVAPQVPWSAVAAVHIDGADAAQAVAAAIEIIDSADVGDLDAEFVLGSAEDFDLAWYAPSEIAYLLLELGLDS